MIMFKAGHLHNNGILFSHILFSNQQLQAMVLLTQYRMF